MVWVWLSKLKDKWKQIATSPSRSFFLICLAFILGIAGAAFFHSWFDDALLFFVILICFFVAYILPEKKQRILFIIIVAFLLGIFRFNQSLVPTGFPTVQDAVGKELRISGQVSGEVFVRSKSQEVVLDQLTVADLPVDGKLLLWAEKYPKINY